ncbi:MAG: hypothetical protein P4L87_09875 [Formivibrio sp.]|nr:hypothetical protein [Formivibrio sp.]
MQMRLAASLVTPIHILDCLISGKEFVTSLNLTAICLMNPYLSQYAESGKNGLVILFLESLGPSEVSPLFRVPTCVTAWGYVHEQATPVDIGALESF